MQYHDSIKLTIIIPVYKVEKYLDFCLESIIHQDMVNCEIILVDDGSPDTCGRLCDQWAQKDTRIKVIHHSTNQGLSAARNTGLDKAIGEYVTFIDSDDYVSPDTLKVNMDLLGNHPDVDVLEYPVCVHHGTDRAYHYQPGNGETMDYIGWINHCGYIHSYAWNKIYKRTLWKTIRFPEGKWFEDLFTIPYVLQQAHVILCSGKGLYYYCNRQGSISTTLSEKSINDLLQANLQLYNTLLSRQDLTEKDLDEIYLRLCDPQILKLQFGGNMCIPERHISLLHAIRDKRPLNYRLKAILKALSGNHYCNIVAKTRKVFRL